MKRFLCAIAVLMMFCNLNAVEAKTLVKSKVAPAKVVNVQSKELPSIDEIVANYNYPIKLVFADIDGTLLYYRDNHKKMIIPQSSRDAAKNLRIAKIPMILATGRDYTEATLVAKNLNNENSYMVLMQGAEVVSPTGKILCQYSINSKDTKNILRDIKKYETSNDMNSEVYFYVNKTKTSPVQLKIPYSGKKTVAIDLMQDVGIKSKANKVMIYDTNDNKLFALKAFLREKYPNYNIDISAPHFCEITNINATKGNAVLQLAKILGVDPRSVAIFGDAENDLSMFKVIKKGNGLAVAVDNAMDIVKQNANYQTLSVYDGGVHYAVNKILDNNALLQKAKTEEKTH